MYIFAQISPLYFQDTQSKSHSPIQSTCLSPHLAHSSPLSWPFPEIIPLWLHSHPCWFLHTSSKLLLQSLCTCYSLWLECSAPHIQITTTSSGLCSSNTQWVPSMPWPPNLKLQLLYFTLHTAPTMYDP